MVRLEKLFMDRGVDFSINGKHSTENHVNIHCPFCGSMDPSYHLGISVENGAYHCWRNPKHSGYNIGYLLSKILKLPKEDAFLLLSRYTDGNTIQPRKKDDSKIGAYVNTFKYDVYKYKLPHIFMKKRGFTDIRLTCDYYGLMYCSYGDFSGRLIIPITDNDNNIVSFTGRDVTGKSEIRYKTLASEYCKMDFSNLVFNINRRETETLIIVEGPLDAMLLEYLVPTLSSWAIMGLDMSVGKLESISRNSVKFKHIFVLIDNDQSPIKSIQYAKMLECHIKKSVSPLFLPKGYKDVGEMGKWDIPNWIYSELSKGY